MGSYENMHPVFRYGALFLAVLAAGATVFAAAAINPNSVAWLLGIYIVLPLFLASMRRRKTSPLHRAYSLYLANLLMYLLIVWVLHALPPGGPPDSPAYLAAKAQAAFWMRVLSIGSIYVPVALFHFTLRFAEVRHPALRGIEYLGWAVFTYFFALNVLDRFCDDWIWMAYTWVPHPTGGYLQFFYWTTLYVTLGLVVPLVKIFRRDTGPLREQLFYFLLGGAPLWFACWTNFLISLGVPMYPSGGLAFLLHAAIMSYAVFRKRVFDVRVVVRRALVYAAVSACLGLGYGLLIWVSSAALGQATDLQATVAGALFVALAGLLFAPLLGHVQGVVDRLFFRREADRHRLLGEFSRKIAATMQLQEIAALVGATLREGLGARAVRLYLADRAGRLSLFGTQDEAFRAERWPSQAPPPPGAEAALAEAEGSALLPWNAGAPGSEPLRVAEAGEALAVPVRHHGQTLGFVLLEPKKADAPYDARDRRFAEAIAAQSAVALAHARAFRRIEQLQQLTSRTLEGLSAGVFLIAASGELLLCNRAGRAMLGLDAGSASSGEAAGLPDLAHPSLARHELAAMLRQAHFSEKGLENVELTVHTPREQTFLMSASRLPEEDGESLTLVLLHDLTEYKAMEEMVRRQEGLAQVGEMISSVNHEVRNILQPVHMQVNRLQEHVEGQVRPAQALRRIQERLLALDRMLANLRNLARPLDLKPRRVELHPLLEDVCNEVADLPAAQYVELMLAEGAAGCACEADPQWLRQVFHNLLLNAADATETCAARKVEVSTDCPADGGGEVRVAVRDSGIGIPEARRALLFTPFHSTKEAGGTGLGLCICKRVLEAHGGRLEVWSQEGMGSVFTAVLPAAKVRPAFQSVEPSPK